MPLSDLESPPPAVGHAADLVGRLDQAFLNGFARLGSDDLATLGALARSFAGTPLAAALDEAIAGIGRSEFLDRHFLVLAAARAAIQGAQHDALVAHASAALGRPAPRLEAIEKAPAQAAPPQIGVWLESTRQWLMEIALAGFANLTLDTILPFQATLEPMQGDPRLARHGSLLGGFVGELLTVFPAKGTPDVPILRWADLWSRAMVLSADVPSPIATRPVSGTLRLVAADLRQHDTFANLVAYGILHEAGGKPPRIVRASISAYKVDVILNEELAPLLGGVGDKLLNALGNGKEIAIKDMPLAATNDLVWDDAKATVGAKFAIMEEAAKALTAAPADRPCLDPADRHPALIEELVYIGALPASLPIERDRWPTTDDLKFDHLAGNSGVVGLLRFDGGKFALQPLAIDKKKPMPTMIGPSLAGGTATKSRNDVHRILKSFAGKLLRKKS